MSFPNPGVYMDVSGYEYHQDRSALSSSTVRAYIESPRIFRWILDGGRRGPANSSSLQFGTLLHDVLLLGRDQIAQIPTEVLGKNGAKSTNAYREWLADNKSKTVATIEEMQAVDEAIASVMADPLAKTVLTGWRGQNETTHVVKDQRSGLLLKARPDRMILDEQVSDDVILVDVKTTSDSRPRKFAKSVTDFGYHYQAAYYRRVIQQTVGIQVGGFVFVAVNNSPPYDCRVYDLAPSSIERAAEDLSKVLLAIRDRIKRDDWELDTHGTYQTIDVPEWGFITD